MTKIKRIMRSLFAPITIMLIPHSSSRTYRIKSPSIGIIIIFIAWASFSAYIINMGITAKKYIEVKNKFENYYSQFGELRATINSLQKSERQFRKIFSLEKKEDIFKTMDATDTGSIDTELIRKQIEQTILNVGEIKDYLRQQRDVFFATPTGYPVSDGYISSEFGMRTHPRSGNQEFHTGADIATAPGTPIRTTADGIVSFSGWSGGSGQLIVVEHGFGFTTCYAHNKLLKVTVGQQVKKGDIVGYVGSTGNTTGPHVHYEVWVNRKPVNPEKYLALHQDVQKTRQN